MNQQDLKQVTDAISKQASANQFQVVPVPAHRHNRTDSLPVNAGDLVGTLQNLRESQSSGTAANFATNHTFYVNDKVSGYYTVVGATAVWGTASTSGTMAIEVCTGTQAITTGTLQLTTPMLLSTAANTTVYGTLIPSPTIIVAGSRVNLLFGGNVANLANASITVTLKRMN